jgi:hypothetical protein
MDWRSLATGWVEKEKEKERKGYICGNRTNRHVPSLLVGPGFLSYLTKKNQKAALKKVAFEVAELQKGRDQALQLSPFSRRPNSDHYTI